MKLNLTKKNMFLAKILFSMIFITYFIFIMIFSFSAAIVVATIVSVFEILAFVKYLVSKDKIEKIHKKQKMYNRVFQEEERIFNSIEDLESHYENIKIFSPETDSCLKFMKFNTYNITKKELKQRYKELAKIYHPDKENGSTELMQKLNESYNEIYRKIK